MRLNIAWQSSPGLKEAYELTECALNQAQTEGGLAPSWRPPGLKEDSCIVFKTCGGENSGTSRTSCKEQGTTVWRPGSQPQASFRSNNVHPIRICAVSSGWIARHPDSSAFDQIPPRASAEHEYIIMTETNHHSYESPRRRPEVERRTAVLLLSANASVPVDHQETLRRLRSPVVFLSSGFRLGNISVPATRIAVDGTHAQHCQSRR